MYSNRKSPVLFAFISLALLALITSACSFHPHMLGNVSQVVDVTIDEDMLTQSRPTFKIHNSHSWTFKSHDHDIWEDLDVDVDRLELHDGYLRFLGTKVMPDGSVADCSIDVVLGAEDGMLTAKIIAVDIPGVAITDSAVVEINHDMEADLYLDGFDANSDVEFQEVEITEDALRIKVLVTVRF